MVYNEESETLYQITKSSEIFIWYGLKLRIVIPSTQNLNETE